MEEEKKPVTSEEFNKKIREENGLPEKVEEPPKKTSTVIVVLIIVFVLAFLAGLVLLGLKAYGDIKKTSTNNPDEPEVVNNNDKPEVKEDTIVTLKEEDIKDVIEKLTNEMIQHAQNLEFEKAAELRDKIKELENIV